MSIRQLSNEQLLVGYQNADLAAFEEFYRRNKTLIYNFLCLRLAGRVDADDAMQEVFSRVHRYILSYDSRLPALGWIFGIAKNVVIDMKTRRGRLPVAEGVDPDSLPDNFVDGLVAGSDGKYDFTSEIEALLSQLRPDEQNLIRSKFLDEKSYEAIATELREKPATIRQRVSRILRRLRTEH